MTNDNFPDKIRARHEAGHAVAYWNMGVILTEVHILPDDRIGGACFHYSPRGSLEKRFVQSAVGLIAGDAALRSLKDPSRPSYGWQDDLHSLWAWIRRRLDEENPRALLFLTDWLIGVTRAIMSAPEVIAQVDAVTTALLCSRRLSADEIDRILSELPQSGTAKLVMAEGIRQAVANVGKKTQAAQTFDRE